MRAFVILGAMSGMAADLDVLVRSATDPLLFLEVHRQFTHSLVFIPFGALLVAAATYPVARRVLNFPTTYFACVLGFASHGLLDACTSYGTQLFWPFDTTRVAGNIISVVDPAFSIPLLTLVVIGFFSPDISRARRWAGAGLIWSTVYLGFGAIQQTRVESAARAMVDARGHAVSALSAKPAFANLLLWKVVYETDGYFHVDAVRAGAKVSICTGSRVPKLDLARDLPDLAQTDRSYRDVERFAVFSSGYLAVDPQQPTRVVDMRYSLIPNQVRALWGIDLPADTSEHARYFTDRSGSREAAGVLWRMAIEGHCPPG